MLYAGRTVMLETRHSHAIIRPQLSTPKPTAVHAKPASPPALQNPPSIPYVYTAHQRCHTITQQQLEVLQSLEPWVDENLPIFFPPPESIWQPSDLLPSPADSGFLERLYELRSRTDGLTNELLVSLAGSCASVEALPNLLHVLNLADGSGDESGAQSHAWARWARAWTSEQRRHGDVLSNFLYLCGRVDSKALQTTVQRLIGSGIDPQLENNPYLTYMYVAFQERASKIRFARMAHLANVGDCIDAAHLCGMVASDEDRHEVAFCGVVELLFERDPEGAMCALATLFRKGVVSPIHLMDDNGRHKQLNPGCVLFQDYSLVLEHTGVFTGRDYGEIVHHLVTRWDVANRKVESAEAVEAQAFLLSHGAHLQRLADMMFDRRLRDRKFGRQRVSAFSWIGGREAACTM